MRDSLLRPQVYLQWWNMFSSRTCSCGECEKCAKRAYDRTRYLARREEKLAQNRRWQEHNRDHLKRYQDGYRVANRDILLAAKRQWYWGTVEVRRQKALAYHVAHGEERRATQRARYELEKENVLHINRDSRERRPEAARRAKRRYKARVRGVPYTSEAETLLPLLRQDPCAYCGGRSEHIDHITPVSRGGDGDWPNLTAACGPCNQSKGQRSLLLFLAERAR